MALTRINKKIDNAIPVNTEDMFLYKRKETNGGEVVVSKRHPELQQLVLNSTMVDILEKCDGKTAVQDLFSTLYRTENTSIYSKLPLSSAYSSIWSFKEINFSSKACS